jgi:hypothetical protein
MYGLTTAVVEAVRATPRSFSIGPRVEALQPRCPLQLLLAIPLLDIHQFREGTNLCVIFRPALYLDRICARLRLKGPVGWNAGATVVRM